MKKVRGCCHVFVKNGKIVKVVTHFDELPDTGVIHCEVSDTLTIPEFVKSHPQDTSDVKTKGQLVEGDYTAPRGQRSRDYSGKVNAPTFAYLTLYGKMPDKPISGREAEHPTKMYRGIAVDKYVPTQALDALNAISDIELRSSCQGEDKRHPTFVIFRPRKQDKEFVKAFVKCMNSHSDIKCGYDAGNQGRFRICVTGMLWWDPARKQEFQDWWLSLAGKIKKCLKK